VRLANDHALTVITCLDLCVDVAPVVAPSAVGSVEGVAVVDVDVVAAPTINTLTLDRNTIFMTYLLCRTGVLSKHPPT
jgi:hypothetical protein